MVKCNQNVSFEEIFTEPSAGKNDGFLLLWGLFKEDIKQNFIHVSIKKSNFSFSWHLQIYKKSIM